VGSGCWDGERRMEARRFHFHCHGVGVPPHVRSDWAETQLVGLPFAGLR